MAEYEAAVASAITLANEFINCVDWFGLIHPGPKRERNRLLLLTKLGIQQARLLIWGDTLGICDLTDSRDIRLEDPKYRAQISSAFKDIVERPAHMDRATFHKTYGLEPVKGGKAGLTRPEPTLDNRRLLAFLERYIALQERGHERRNMSLVITHWTIQDPVKFEDFVRLCRKKIDGLIELMGNAEAVDRAVKQDIKALGWQPMFNKADAARDMQKLSLIADACTEDYPEYTVVAKRAHEYVEAQWKDYYTDLREGRQRETGMPAEWTEKEMREQRAAGANQARKGSLASVKGVPSRKGFLSRFRPHSWSKNDRRASEADVPSTSPPSTELDDPQRSVSLSVDFGKEASAVSKPVEGEVERVESSSSTEKALQHFDTNVSRHDYVFPGGRG